eukprot:PhM_4_TR9642/c0_g1_i2/m.3187
MTINNNKNNNALFFIMLFFLTSMSMPNAAALRVTPVSKKITPNNACPEDGSVGSGWFSATCQNMVTFNGNIFFLTSEGADLHKNRLRYYIPSTETFKTAIGDSSCVTETGLTSPSGLHVFNNELYLLNTGSHTILKIYDTYNGVLFDQIVWIGIKDVPGNSVNVVAGINVNVNAPTRMTHLAGTLYFAQSSSTGEYELMRVAATTQMLSSVVALANTPVSLTVLHGKMLFATEVVGSPSAVLQSV